MSVPGGEQPIGPARLIVEFVEHPPLTDDSDSWRWAVYLVPRRHPDRKERIAASEEPQQWAVALTDAVDAINEAFTE